LRVDALHGEAGQKLHSVFLSATGGLLRRRSSGADPISPNDGRIGADSGAMMTRCQEKRPQYIGVALPPRFWHIRCRQEKINHKRGR
jgi:hypothetical protein